MFIGSIDKHSKIIVSKLLESISSKKIYVGCSGNFTFDRIAFYKGFKVHSNDVSLYSTLIAGIVQNKPFPCFVVPMATGVTDSEVPTMRRRTSPQVSP